MLSPITVEIKPKIVEPRNPKKGRFKIKLTNPKPIAWQRLTIKITYNAWMLALLSCSTSLYNFESSFNALNILCGRELGFTIKDIRRFPL